MLDYIIEKDKERLCCLDQMDSTETDTVWLVIANELVSIPLYVFLLHLCCKYFHWKKVLLILVYIALVVVITDQLANIFRHGFQWLRLCHDETLTDRTRMVTCGGKYGSFPVHANNTVAAAVFFGKLLKERLRYITPFLLRWSLVASYSRIYLGVHFPGDVLISLTIGALLGLLCYRLLLWLEKKIL